VVEVVGVEQKTTMAMYNSLHRSDIKVCGIEEGRDVDEVGSEKEAAAMHA